MSSKDEEKDRYIGPTGSAAGSVVIGANGIVNPSALEDAESLEGVLKELQ